MPNVDTEFDGQAQRISLYGKGTVAGDTVITTLGTAGALRVSQDSAPGTLSDGVANSPQVPTVPGTSILYAPGYPFIFNGATWDRWRTPSKFNHVLATAAGNTAVWTPAAGKKFRLMRFAVGISGGTLLAVAGIETITFQDSAAGIGGVRFDVQVPSTVVTGEEYFSGWIDWGNGFLSAAANNVLNVNLGTATTAGGVTVMVAGCEE